jgi:hypothetical protein
MWLSACVGIGFGETNYSPICLALFDFLPADDVYRHRKRIDALRDSSHRANSPRPGAIKGRAALMSDIFISYKREDQATARKLADALESEGWTVWWDPKLRTGEIFDDVIEKALTSAKCVVVLWSEGSVKSQYVRDEATYALERNKLVPVAIEAVEMPFRFRGIHTLRLFAWDGSRDSSDFRKFVDDISSKIIPDHTERPEEKRLREQERQRSEEETKRKADEKSKGSWWQTVPGILIGLAGIITAIAGLIVVLHQYTPSPSVRAVPCLKHLCLQQVQRDRDPRFV